LTSTAFDERFRFLAAGTRSDSDEALSPAQAIKDAYTKTRDLEGTLLLEECTFSASDAPEDIATIALDGLDAVVIDQAARPEDLVDTLDLLLGSLAAPHCPGLWQTKRHKRPAPATPTVQAEKRPSFIARRLSKISSRGLQAKPQSPLLSSSSSSGPRSPIASFSAEPEDYFGERLPPSSKRHSRGGSLSQLSRTLSSPFKRSQSTSSMSASDTSTSESSLADTSTSSSTRRSPFEYCARVIVISDDPEPEVFAALNRLARPDSRGQLEGLVKDFQHRHGLEYDLYCLWTGTWDHLPKEKTRPAYTRKVASGRGEERVSKDSIRLVKTRWIKCVPLPLSCDAD
jgi:hypothetical protein